MEDVINRNKVYENQINIVSVVINKGMVDNLKVVFVFLEVGNDITD